MGLIAGKLDWLDCVFVSCLGSKGRRRNLYGKDEDEGRWVWEIKGGVGNFGKRMEEEIEWLLLDNHIPLYLLGRGYENSNFFGKFSYLFPILSKFFITKVWN